MVVSQGPRVQRQQRAPIAAKVELTPEQRRQLASSSSSSSTFLSSNPSSKIIQASSVSSIQSPIHESTVRVIPQTSRWTPPNGTTTSPIIGYLPSNVTMRSNQTPPTTPDPRLLNSSASKPSVVTRPALSRKRSDDRVSQSSYMSDKSDMTDRSSFTNGRTKVAKVPPHGRAPLGNIKVSGVISRPLSQAGPAPTSPTHRKGHGRTQSEIISSPSRTTTSHHLPSIEQEIIPRAKVNNIIEGSALTSIPDLDESPLSDNSNARIQPRRRGSSVSEHSFVGKAGGEPPRPPSLTSSRVSSLTQGAAPLAQPMLHSPVTPDDYVSPNGPLSPSLSSLSTLSDPARMTPELSELLKMMKVADEAKTNRKILDLEISNKSLMAINASLEVKSRKQASEISLLKDKIINNEPLDAYTLAQLTSMIEEKDEDYGSDDELSDPDEADFEQDERFRRICLSIDNMVRDGKMALDRRETFKPGRNRVLMAHEVAADSEDEMSGSDESPDIAEKMGISA